MVGVMGNTHLVMAELAELAALFQQEPEELAALALLAMVAAVVAVAVLADMLVLAEQVALTQTLEVQVLVAELAAVAAAHNLI
jgi:hypothetical protein